MKETPMDENAYHHAVIGRAIDFIGERVKDQPSLDEVADAVGLSPAHFQRVFSKWAGVSPKRYQQYLTLDHAKSLLRERHSLLDTAYETGLSGTGRLHDLFLRWEAMSPGDYATGGAGLTIRWDWAETPFGEALVMATDRGLCGLAFSAECGRAEAMADMRARWPEADYVQDPSMPALLEDVMSPQGQGQLHLIG
ncbi:MAG: AraC family transcriptional regulator, partial [Pseudomonadota bacterium]